jgi:lipopolysaccharide/colanic/teichoic acid biosynthesis glycosyltransferase
VTAPILAVVAVMIRLTSRGPVLFRHQRLGRDFEPFHCLKFRTMHRDSERIMEELRRTRPDIDGEFSSNFKLRDDPRVSRLGRLLRKTSIDELPQLFNVLRGEMSLVGPRPIIAAEGEMYGPHLPIVLSVRPGLTGAWQVAGRNKIGYPERVDLDVNYVNRKSTTVDLAILLKTPAALLDWDATS